MKRVWTTSLLSVCFGLALAASYVVSVPPTTLAATGSAYCGYGITATCAGFACSCIDGVGCNTFDSNGNLVRTVSCETLIREAGPIAQSGPQS